MKIESILESSITYNQNDFDRNCDCFDCIESDGGDCQ